jgi:hypothetical protein
LIGIVVGSGGGHPVAKPDESAEEHK